MFLTGFRSSCDDFTPKEACAEASGVMVVLRAPQRSLAHGQTAPVVTGGVIKSPHRLPFARLSAAPSAFGPVSSSFYFFSVFFFFLFPW